MDTQLVEFSIDSGKSIFIEVHKVKGEIEASNNKIKKTFQEVIETARDTAELIIGQMDGLQDCSENGPQEIDVEFGLKVDSKVGGKFVISLGGEVNLKVTLKWRK